MNELHGYGSRWARRLRSSQFLMCVTLYSQASITFMPLCVYSRYCTRDAFWRHVQLVSYLFPNSGQFQRSNIGGSTVGIRGGNSGNTGGKQWEYRREYSGNKGGKQGEYRRQYSGNTGGYSGENSGDTGGYRKEYWWWIINEGFLRLRAAWPYSSAREDLERVEKTRGGGGTRPSFSARVAKAEGLWVGYTPITSLLP